MDPEVAAFVRYVLPLVESAKRGLDQLDALDARVGRNPRLLNERSFLIELLGPLETISKAGKGLQQYQPVTAKISRANNTYVLIGTDLVYIADEYAEGILFLDETRIQNAAQRRRLMAQRFAEVASLVEAMAGAR